MDARVGNGDWQENENLRDEFVKYVNSTLAPKGLSSNQVSYVCMEPSYSRSSTPIFRHPVYGLYRRISLPSFNITLNGMDAGIMDGWRGGGGGFLPSIPKDLLGLAGVIKEDICQAGHVVDLSHLFVQYQGPVSRKTR